MTSSTKQMRVNMLLKNKSEIENLIEEKIFAKKGEEN